MHLIITSHKPSSSPRLLLRIACRTPSPTVRLVGSARHPLFIIALRKARVCALQRTQRLLETRCAATLLCLPGGTAMHCLPHCFLHVRLCLQVTKIRYVYRDADQECNLTSLSMGPGNASAAASWQSRASAYFECVVADAHGRESPPTAFAPSIDKFEEWFLNACKCRPGVFFNPNKEGTKAKQVCHGCYILLPACRPTQMLPLILPVLACRSLSSSTHGMGPLARGSEPSTAAQRNLWIQLASSLNSSRRDSWTSA